MLLFIMISVDETRRITRAPCYCYKFFARVFYSAGIVFDKENLLTSGCIV
jgi:hypothetical protein